MKRLILAFPILLCVAGVASSQSLADVAKKEKERRKENAEQGNKTVFEAESVGSFGHVWWRGEDVTTTTATGEAPSAKSNSEAAPDETTTQGGTRSKRGELPLRKSSRRLAPRFEVKSIDSSSAKSDSEAAPATTTAKGGTWSKRGNLSLRKSSGRRR